MYNVFGLLSGSRVQGFGPSGISIQEILALDFATMEEPFDLVMMIKAMDEVYFELRIEKDA